MVISSYISSMSDLFCTDRCEETAKWAFHVSKWVKSTTSLNFNKVVEKTEALSRSFAVSNLLNDLNGCGKLVFSGDLSLEFIRKMTKSVSEVFLGVFGSHLFFSSKAINAIPVSTFLSKVSPVCKLFSLCCSVNSIYEENIKLNGWIYGEGLRVRGREEDLRKDAQALKTTKEFFAIASLVFPLSYIFTCLVFESIDLLFDAKCFFADKEIKELKKEREGR